MEGPAGRLPGVAPQRDGTAVSSAFDLDGLFTSPGGADGGGLGTPSTRAASDPCPGGASVGEKALAVGPLARGYGPRGAHLLLQVRTRVLNDQLAGDFHRSNPGLSRTLDPVTLAALASPTLSRSPQPVLRALFSKVDTLAVFMARFLPAPPLRRLLPLTVMVARTGRNREELFLGGRGSSLFIASDFS